jgi:hypothetical protein
VLGLLFVLACTGSAAPRADAGSDAGALDGGATSDGGIPDGGVPACVDQSCAGAACCSGAYCWGFTDVCLANGTCPGAGVTEPDPSRVLCSCDGFAAEPCPDGGACPTAVHGHATYCQ